jgi:peptidoglycan hydrolase CwlO-like protein
LELFANGTALDPAIDKLVKKIEAVKDKIEGKQAKIAELKKD